MGKRVFNGWKKIIKDNPDIFMKIFLQQPPVPHPDRRPKNPVEILVVDLAKKETKKRVKNWVKERRQK